MQSLIDMAETVLLLKLITPPKVDALLCSPNLTIRKSGYKKINEYFPSDHVALWADFDIQEILGKNQLFHLHVHNLYQSINLT